MKIHFEDTMLVTVTGIIIVFIVLILLVLIMYLFGKVASSGSAKKGEKAQEIPAPAKQKVAPSAGLASALPTGDDDELIAVIAAAVQALSESSGKSYAVRSVRPSPSRPVWASAGIYENTRPF